jgi:hypothetical protein
MPRDKREDYSMSNLSHRFDRAEGGCVCGSSWFPGAGCSAVIEDFGIAWLDAYYREDN